ncbi:pentapeptide repeat-containing protein [Candidatus Latescibacterota bacterium]
MPDEDGKLIPGQLRVRWRYTPGEEFREKIIEQLQNKENRYAVDWENLEVTVKGKTYKWEDFTGVNELINRRDLRGVGFWGEQLEHADFWNAHLEHAYLDAARLDYANLWIAHLEHANLSYTHLKYANLSGAKFEYAYLSNANFEHANLNGSKFNLKSFKWRVMELLLRFKNDLSKLKFFRLIMDSFKINYHLNNLIIRPDRPTILTGAELKNVKLDEDPILYRKLLDEQYLDAFAKNHKVLYPFWLLTSNCGRSTSLVFFWALFITILFGFIYSLNDYIYFGELTGHVWWYPYYFSFVTITTLGMSSVEPVSFWGAFWHTIENIFGYGLLGYAIAVLGSKFTRRSA